MFCYVDESGCTGALPSAESVVSPVLVVLGVAARRRDIRAITGDWLYLKSRFFPSLLPVQEDWLNWMRAEIKGANLRRLARSESRNQRRAAFGVIDETLKILERYDAKIFGRVWIKPVGGEFKGKAVYAASMQYIAEGFQKLLAARDAAGVIIADSRRPGQNRGTSHSVFTRKHSARGDVYPRIGEAPLFGDSQNHAGLQIADLLCSALIFPIAAEAYCGAHISNRTHRHPAYLGLRDRFGTRLMKRQFACRQDKRHIGGIAVSDPQGGRHGGHLFRAC